MATTSTVPLTRALEQLDLHLRASYKLIHFCSQEELRAERELVRIARRPQPGVRTRTCFVWTETGGFIARDIGTDERLITAAGLESPKDTQAPLKALRWVFERESKADQSALYVFKDLHPYLDPKRGQASVIRQLKDVAQAMEPTYSAVVLLSGPQMSLPPELEKECVIIDFDLPTVDEIERAYRALAADYADAITIALKPAEFRDLAEAAKGLTMAEAELAFGKAVVRDRRLDRADISSITDEKKQIVRKTGILTFEQPGRMEDVGGLEVLKRWLERRTRVFSPEAREFGIEAPKGVMLTGIPGCGKTLCARAMASIWALPILRLDMGSVMGGIVGSSEANLRTATRSAEAMSPCILMIDEIEKGLAGASGGGGDGGTTQRVFGYLLSWMNDKTAPVFVIATANNFERLPPELLRKGRFDEIFFVDFPNQVERRRIFEIHVQKSLVRRAGTQKMTTEQATAFLRGFNFEKEFEVNRSSVEGGVRRIRGNLVQLSRNYTGSEIEEAVKTALIDAFANDREFSAEDVARALANTVPLIDTMRDGITRIRERAMECAVSASLPEADEGSDVPLDLGDDRAGAPVRQPDVATTTPTAVPPNDGPPKPSRGGRMLDL